MPDLGVIWDKPLSQGHLMKTEAHLRGSDGLLVAQTRTRSVVLLGGFHGAVQAYIADENGEIIATSNKHTYGVDGQLIGNSDRTDTWSQSFGADVGNRARQIAIVHSWDAQWLSSIANTIKFIRDLIEILVSAKKGNAGSGGPMGWPQRPPYTRGTTAGRRPPIRIERPAPAAAGEAVTNGDPDGDDEDLLAYVSVGSIDEPIWSNDPEE